MGQQVPFETLDSLAEGIMRVATPASPAEGWKPRIRAVRVGEQTVQRVELDVLGRETQKPYELHLYEAYWAPTTEGVAGLKDVVSFLMNGAGRGLLNCWKSFDRALFRQIRRFKVPKLSALYIALVLLVFGALAVMNAVILAASAIRMHVASQVFSELLTYWKPITSAGSAVSAIAITCGCILYFAEMCRQPALPGRWRRVLGFVSWVGCFVAVVGIILAGVLLGTEAKWGKGLVWLGDEAAQRQVQGVSTVIILVSMLLVLIALSVRGWVRSDTRALKESTVSQLTIFITLFVEVGLCVLACLNPFLRFAGVDWGLSAWSLMPEPIRNFVESPFWVWPFLIFVSAQVRMFLIEYVGDVAIYVASNKIDRFDSARAKIKDIALKSASAVYLANNAAGSGFAYDHIAVVGHSLGSVIAYDTLNRLMNEDLLSGNRTQVVDRTKLFLTFGSPLDKVAFFFTIQGKDKFEVREQLATSVQPLILDAKCRQFPWINVYSRNDIISGHLEYYDPQGTFPGQKVQNVRDKDACIALAAHVDYWTNTTTWDELCNTIAP